MVSTEQVDAGARVDPPAPAGSDPESPRRRRRAATLVGLVAGLVAVVCAAALPLAPVAVNQPTVSWPQDPAAPVSTALQLSTYRPLALDLTASCRALRAAAATPDGTVLATMSAQAMGASGRGLLVRAAGGALDVRSGGVEVGAVPLPPGDCALALRVTASGLAVTLDGARVLAAGPDALPDVDALRTSVAALPGGTRADLGVSVLPDDRFATSPTALKDVVLVVLLLAMATALGAVAATDRASAAWRRARGADPTRAGPRPLGARVVGWVRRRRPRVIDVVVPAVMVLWVFLAPMGDDDGYYSAMARNVRFSGYVSNYYQLYTQGFTPFTWIYYALSWWQQVAGISTVALRVPALVLGLATWAAARSYVSRTRLLAGPDGAPRDDPWWLRTIAPVALGLAFLTWWLPYDMGDRPEPVVAATALGALVLLTEGVERGRAVLVAAAVGVAAFGLTAAPTGFVALGPLLVGAPAVWRMLRRDSTPLGTVARLVAVVAPGAIGSVLAFADGSVRDFLRAQELFLGIQSQESWYTEIVRWEFLFSGSPMGSYARRAAVLVALVALAWCAVLVAAGRARGVLVPPRLVRAAAATTAGFALLWLTPSKWTHHFGALAGLGGVFLALLLVSAPVLVRRLHRDRRVPVPLVVVAALSFAIAFALASHGIQSWPYSWLLGLPHTLSAPQVWIVAFDQPLWWLLGIAVVTGLLALAARRRAPALRGLAGVAALPVAVCVFFLAISGYLVGGFALATARTWNTWSPWEDALANPSGSRCGAASQVQVLDPASARLLPPAPVPAPAPGPAFSPGAWFPASPPPAGLPAAVPVWGSFRAPAGTTDADAAIGRFSSPWYALPSALPDGQALSTTISGRSGDGETVRVEYGRLDPRAPGGVAPLGGRDLSERPDHAVDTTTWRAVTLEGSAAQVPGADVVRLVAEDLDAGVGGWTAFSAPTVQTWRQATQVLPSGGARAVGWEFVFLFPCERLPVQADGVNEPVDSAILWGDQTLSGLDDAVWQPGRGGLFAQSLREGEASEYATRLRDAPDVRSIQAYRIDQSLPPHAYDLTRRTEVVSGATVAPTWVDPG